MRTVAPPPRLIHYCRRKPITPAQPYKRTVAIYLKGCRLSLQECPVPSFSNSHFRHTADSQVSRKRTLSCRNVYSAKPVSRECHGSAVNQNIVRIDCPLL